VLAAHGARRGQRLQRLHDGGALVPQRGQAGLPRRIHQDRGQDLEHVVLHDVPDGAGTVVEAAPIGDVEGLRHRDLDTAHVRAVEDRLEDAVGEPGEQHVLDRVEAEPVVDAVDRVLREDGVHGGVQLARARQVGAERLLDHDPGVGGQVGPGEALGDHAEQRRRDLQVEQRRAAGQQDRERRVRRVVGEVAVDVLQQIEHPLGRIGVRVDAVASQ
jgi:hypothetical protein